MYVSNRLSLFDLETAPAEINASAKIMKSMADSADSNIVEISNEIWKELEAACCQGSHADQTLL
jgi:hypothetical protein